MRRITFVAVASIIFVGGCKGSPQPESANEVAATASEDSPQELTEPTSPSSGEPEPAYLTHVTGLRREPTEARKVEVAGKKNKVSNWMMTLYRGEEVGVLRVDGEWARVKASDDSEGWVKKDSLLPTAGVSLATVFEKTKTFDRPDLLAQNTSRVVEPGALLFVLKAKDQFTEVNYYGQGSTWVLTQGLATDAREIAAAKLLAKVQWLQERKDADAGKVMELARSQLGDTRLLGMADAEGRIGGEVDGAEPEPEPEPQPE